MAAIDTYATSNATVMTPSSLSPSPVRRAGTTQEPVSADEVVDYVRPREGVPPICDTPVLLADAVARLTTGSGPIAVDAERASGFRYGQEAYLIQLRRQGTGTLLIDPRSCGPTTALAQAMNGSEWILHAADQDLPCLAELGLAPAKVFDTELAARILGRSRIGLGAVLEETLGLRLAKDHAAADWSTRPLPPTWLNYAALDVELLIELRQTLLAELRAAGRLEWFEQECEYVRTRPAKPAKIDPWRHLPHAGRATRSARSLAVLRELWTVRETLAQELDLTPSKVLPHAAIVSAAIVQPTSRRKLMSLKDFSSRQARLNQEQWWRAVERALALPEKDLPPRKAPLAPGEVPAPRTWGRNHELACSCLDVVRNAVRRQAQVLAVPQELLLTPATQRRLAWDMGESLQEGCQPPVGGEGAYEDQLDAYLEHHQARPWQRQHVVKPLASALGRWLTQVTPSR